jgi:hypothetical protein
LVCEEGIFDIKVINNLLVPQSSKIGLAQKPQTIPCGLVFGARTFM